MIRKYIHQLKEWPAFQYDPEVLLPLFSQVKEQQGRLLGKMSAMGFELQESATVKSLTETIIKTSLIEGESLNEIDVRSSVAFKLGMDIGGAPAQDRHTEGVVEMMLNATFKYNEPLTRDRINNWHAALFPTGRNAFGKITVGGWRKGPMSVVSGSYGKEKVHFEAPKANKIPEEMTAFLEWFGNDNNDLVLKSAIAHLYFVTIHPYSDGNGRIARAIADMCLAASDGSSQRFYSMSAAILKNQKAYYAILEQTQKGSMDITVWLDWYLNTLLESFEAAEQTLATVVKKHTFWTAHSETKINDRQRKVLNKLLDGFDSNMTRKRYCSINRTSTATATRDLKELVQAGMLSEEGVGRGIHYVLS